MRGRGPNPATLDWLFPILRDSGQFYIDSHGRIWSNRKQGKGRYRNPLHEDRWVRCERPNGYGRNRISVPAPYTKEIITARFIWWWFNGEIPEGYEVDHKDDNKLNDHPDNLQLLTSQENWDKSSWKVRVPGWKKKGDKVL